MSHGLTHMTVHARWLATHGYLWWVLMCKEETGFKRDVIYRHDGATSVGAKLVGSAGGSAVVGSA